MVAFRVDDAQLALIQQAAMRSERKIADFCRLIVLRHAHAIVKGEQQPYIDAGPLMPRRKKRS